MHVVIVDGQGGGIGKTLIERIKAAYGSRVFLTALGTNPAAAAAMSKAGADRSKTGEAAICAGVKEAHVIVGTVGIIAAGAMRGELTPRMARAIAESPAPKILIPLGRCNIHIAGVENTNLSSHIEDAVRMLCSFFEPSAHKSAD